MELFQGSSDGNAVADRQYRQLKKDSEEIDRALEDFLRERASANKLQQDAFDAYDAEMMEIGGLDENFEEEFETKIAVEHNILRSINAAQEAADSQFSYEDEIEFAEDELEIAKTESNRPLTKTTTRKGSEMASLAIPPQIMKKPPPNAEQKSVLREEIFKIFEAAHAEEDELETELNRLKELGSDVDQIEKAAEVLFLVQKSNAAKLKVLFEDYQPTACGRSWGTDPDYAAITECLRLAAAGGKLTIKKLLKSSSTTDSKPKKKVRKAKKRTS